MGPGRPLRRLPTAFCLLLSADCQLLPAYRPLPAGAVSDASQAGKMAEGGIIGAVRLESGDGDLLVSGSRVAGIGLDVLERHGLILPVVRPAARVLLLEDHVLGDLAALA